MFQEQQRQESSFFDDIISAFGSFFSTEQGIEEPKLETTSFFQSFFENDAGAGSSSMQTHVRQRHREHTYSVQRSAGECATEFCEFLRPSASLQGEIKTFASKEQSQKQGEKKTFASKEQSRKQGEIKTFPSKEQSQKQGEKKTFASKEQLQKQGEKKTFASKEQSQKQDEIKIFASKEQSQKHGENMILANEETLMAKTKERVTAALFTVAAVIWQAIVFLIPTVSKYCFEQLCFATIMSSAYLSRCTISCWEVLKLFGLRFSNWLDSNFSSMQNSVVYAFNLMCFDFPPDFPPDLPSFFSFLLAVITSAYDDLCSASKWLFNSGYKFLCFVTKWLFNSGYKFLCFVTKWLFNALRKLLFVVIDLLCYIPSLINKCIAELVAFIKNLGILVKILLFVILSVVALVVLIILALN